ncbi:MAG TPA: VWA domain-containing protein [Pyrinomonadaceae bacterium]|nr:VWA domain-containing protein [Pyrinomonadaceae bacterium]
MRNRIVILLISATVTLLAGLIFTAAAQQATPAMPRKPVVKPGDPSKPTPTNQPVTTGEQEPIRISTEEVQLSVAAFDNDGRVDPSLERDDVLVLEDGVPQEIRSVRRLPANVILLLDTGGELNSAKRVTVTREVAKSMVNSLASDDQISVLQFNSKVELLMDWTSDHQSVLSILQSQLLPAKRALFFDALAEAAARFVSSNRLNRHLVLVTDGVHTGVERLDRTRVIEQLITANVAVHVISYTMVSQTAMKQDLRRTRKRDKSISPDDAVNSLPGDIRDNTMKQLHKPGGIIVDLDLKRRRMLQEYQNALAVSQAQLQQLAHDTGGGIWLPESVEIMIDNARDAARLIDSAYVITYRPKRPLADALAGEERRIEIVSRRVGLHVMTRQRYVVPNNTIPRRTGN